MVMAGHDHSVSIPSIHAVWRVFSGGWVGRHFEVFETGTFGRSVTPPRRRIIGRQWPEKNNCTIVLGYGVDILVLRRCDLL
jgi:hypothetical protein